MVSRSIALWWMRFDWDIKKLALWYLPSFFRNESQVAFINVLLKPLLSGFEVFLNYRSGQIYESYLTGQTIQLQRLANDRFDNELRRIVIIHSADADLVLYLDEENQPAQDLNLYLDSEDSPSDDLMLYLDSEAGGALPFDFRVIAPISLQTSEVELYNIIRQYALINKTFDIIFV